MSTPQSRLDVSGIDYHLGDDVLWTRDGRIWTGRIESVFSANEDTVYVINFSGAETVEVDDTDILGCAAGFWCHTCGGKMKEIDSTENDPGIVQAFECVECGGTGDRYFEFDSAVDNRGGLLQPANSRLEGKPVDYIPERSQPSDGR